MPQPVIESTRRYARIDLAENILGTLDGAKAVVIDVSLSGALVAHQKRLEPAEQVVLQFAWRGDSISILGEVVRTFLFRRAKGGMTAVYRSGLRFIRFQSESGANGLRKMIAELVGRALDEQRANALGIPPEFASSKPIRKSEGYVCYRLVDGKWLRSRSATGAQPPDGFTISVEDDRQASMLCDAYERSLPAEREMIRTMAKQTVGQDPVPVRRFEP